MHPAVDALSFVFDFESHPAQLEDSRAVLTDPKIEDRRQRNPSACGLDEQAKDAAALVFAGVRAHQVAAWGRKQTDGASRDEKALKRDVSSRDQK